MHNRCVRGGYYEEGVFAKEYGDPECLVELGCWGPVVQCNIVERGALRHYGGCMSQGGICIGCTMPGFPDKFSPFYAAPPGSAISTNAVPAYGRIVRFLRGISQFHQNRSAHWDRVEDVPSGWALQRGQENVVGRLIDYAYRKFQFLGSVEPGRTLSETRYRDGWEVAAKKQDPSHYTGEMKWGYARRRAKLERERAAARES